MKTANYCTKFDSNCMAHALQERAVKNSGAWRLVKLPTYYIFNHLFNSLSIYQRPVTPRHFLALGGIRNNNFFPYEAYIEGR